MVKRYAFTMIELIFAIIVISIVVLALPSMTDVISNSAKDTMRDEEAIFQAYVKALEVTDGNYSALPSNIASINGTITTAVDTLHSAPSDISNTIKSHAIYKSYASITQGPASGFGGNDGGDNNISLVTVTIEDNDGVIAKLYTYDFNVQR